MKIHFFLTFDDSDHFLWLARLICRIRKHKPIKYKALQTGPIPIFCRYCRSQIGKEIGPIPDELRAQFLGKSFRHQHIALEDMSSHPKADLYYPLRQKYAFTIIKKEQPEKKEEET